MFGPEATRPRKVAFLTGTRADFGKLKSLMGALTARSDRFDVHIFATGMHVNPTYGFTVREIEKCGLPNISRFENHRAGGGMDDALAMTIQGFGRYVRGLRPDLIVVHGDRPEALAGAIVGMMNNVLVAHVEGGELSGTVDGVVRHSVSKMSHLHFVANGEARDRLLQLGEASDRIFVIGSPDIDSMFSADLPSLSAVRRRYAIDFERYGLLVLHPVTTELDTLSRQVEEVIAGCLSSGLPWIAIYPNSDHGSQLILSRYEQHLAGHRRVRLFPSVRFEAALVLLRHAAVIVGNSSMGIREAPYYGTPTVDVGSRQQGRSDNPHITHVAACRLDVERAVRRAVRRPRLRPTREWGEGNSHARFLEVLLGEAVWQTGLSKAFVDRPRPQRPDDRAA